MRLLSLFGGGCIFTHGCSKFECDATISEVVFLCSREFYVSIDVELAATR